MIRCLFLGHKWDGWYWLSEGLTIGSWWQRECLRCGFVETAGENPDLRKLV